jgi:hypothetical protein
MFSVIYNKTQKGENSMPEKPEKWKNKTLNPENPDHKKVIETIESFVKRKGRIDQSDLVREIRPILDDKGVQYSSDYVVKLMAEGGREYLRERAQVQIQEERRGGNPAKVYENTPEEEV